MWNDRLRIAESVEAEWSALNEADRGEAFHALEKIDEDPLAGTPLLGPLRGFWSYRIGVLRIIYRIVAEARFIVILAINRVEETKKP
ncbi:MAG TPA: type II toxin-antitoxin system RelE/ParE family toxin [Thermoanaerobaculia bacterium]|nr:type II toxin-antitoxin system RelE/ParE family toxin [Thermoanaerobaculia bacterium]